MLLISQDSDLTEVVQSVLSRIHGLKLEVLKDHEEAVERVTRSNAALVLSHLSVNCHVGSLTRLLGTITATGKRIPMLVLSDDYHAEQALTLFRLGIADYL